jgi:hypothetical protein
MKKITSSVAAFFILLGLSTAAIGDGNVKVFLGDEPIGVSLPASVVSEVQEIVQEMGGFSSFNRDAGKFKIERPLVNMLILEGIQQTKSKDIVFTNPIKGFVDRNVPRDFGVFVEVDEAIPSKELTVKVVIVAPNGKIAASGRERTFSTTETQDSFFFSEPFISTKLDQFGTYKVQVLMKRGKNSPYVVVEENTFTVGR